jgi:hypothetical protein
MRVLSKRKTPRGVWALRGVTIAIALVVILAVGTVVYSAYEDYSAVRPELSGGSSQPVGGITQNGNTATVSLTFTIPNAGLYTLNVTLTCDNSNPNVVCQAGHVSVPPGGKQVLRFNMTITNVQQYIDSGDRRINGTLAMALEPFVSISIGTDLSGLVNIEGG